MTQRRRASSLPRHDTSRSFHAALTAVDLDVAPAELQAGRKSLVPLWRPAQEVYDDAKVVLQRQKTVQSLSAQLQELDLQGHLKRRHRCSRFQHFLESSKFQIGMGVVISWNCVLVVLDVQRLLGHSVITDCLELLFAGAFLVEWCLQVCIYGLPWFLKPQHMMNTTLVCISLFTAVLSVANPDTTIYTRSWLERLMRVLRLLWVGRMFHVVKAHKDTVVFSELWLLIYGLQTSAQTLGSALVLIVITLYIFGIGGVYLIGEATYNEPSAAATAAQQQFDNLGDAMLTLMRFMNADNAQDILDALMEQQPYIWTFTWLFTALTAFVLMNLVTAVIVQQALKSTQDDAEQQAFEKAKEDMSAMRELENLFRSLDTDGSGSVSLLEFERLFSRAEMRQKLERLGIAAGEPRELFDLLDAVKDGSLDTEEFIRGMRSVRGQASSKDLLVLTKQLERMRPDVERVHDKQVSKATQDIASDALVKRIQDLKAQVSSRCDTLEGRLKSVTSGLKEIIKLSGKLETARHTLRDTARAERGGRSRSKGRKSSDIEEEASGKTEHSPRGEGHAEDRRKHRDAQRARKHREQAHRHREEKARGRELEEEKEKHSEDLERQRSRLLEERQERAARRAEHRYHRAARESEPGTIVWGRRRGHGHHTRRGGGRADEFRLALEEARLESDARAKADRVRDRE